MKHDASITGTRPELLAPAGKLSVFRSVLEAGADAVYVAGKQFNMRRHRSDFNFSAKELATATNEAHDAGKKLYVTVNSLVGQHEVPPLRDYLQSLDDMGVDAVILQDLAVVQLCDQMGLSLPLHSSTMMNVSGVDTARLLKSWGFTRLVTSRDITVADVRQIRDHAGIEVEYFLHGDLCSALSGQCLSSGLIFGKSGNRGQCMKPCRWAYDLVSESTGETLREGAYLLASKDMCLLQHIAELVTAGVDSLKIEGRMRPAETLVPIVEAYREIIDAVVSEPMAPAKRFDQTQLQRKARTRDLTTGFAFKHPDDSFMDVSGSREPLVFSTHGHLRTSAESALRHVDAMPVTLSGEAVPEVSVVVGASRVARAVLDAGCDRLILSWEADLTAESGWSLSEIAAVCEWGRELEIPVMLTTPRVLDDRASRELRRVVTADLPLDGYVVASIGALEVVRPSGGDLWGDAALNVLNAGAASWLTRHGISRVMPSLEASLPAIYQMAQAAAGCEWDLLVHGPLTGMLLEHCVVAMNMQHASKRDFCPMPCMADQFSMVDKAGTKRVIRQDRYCRTHVMMEHDVAALPVLEQVLLTGPASVRVNAVIYEPALAARVVEFYRRWLHCPEDRAAMQSRFEDEFPSDQHTLGAYPVGICRDDEISRLKLKREGKRVES